MPSVCRAVVYIFWGERHLREAIASAASAVEFTKLPVVAITDKATGAQVPSVSPFNELVIAQPTAMNLLAKAELFSHVPEQYDTFLFLDSDTTVIGDVSYGFEKAEEAGIAAAMAPHYSLDHFWGFDRVLSVLNTPCVSQLQYNTGVMFVHLRPDVREVCATWRALAMEFGQRLYYATDQPFFTLAMELLHFNPFTLSPAYNYRALGELASGSIRIWHSHAPVPPDVNDFDHAWPPRRFLGSQRVPYDCEVRRSSRAIAWLRRYLR